jgi:hypothetical protein
MAKARSKKDIQGEEGEECEEEDCEEEMRFGEMGFAEAGRLSVKEGLSRGWVSLRRALWRDSLVGKLGAM